MTHCEDGLQLAARVSHLLPIDSEAAILVMIKGIRSESNEFVAAFISALMVTTGETICICKLPNCPLSTTHIGSPVPYKKI